MSDWTQLELFDTINLTEPKTEGDHNGSTY